jgi:hypothetical protein|tara:strand:- start:97 stop:462 length:366 start_codon:yes stop_codon:yes gene_type:complete
MGGKQKHYSCTRVGSGRGLASGGRDYSLKVVERIEQVGQGWSRLAHALFSAFQQLDGHISTNEREEQTILENTKKGYKSVQRRCVTCAKRKTKINKMYNSFTWVPYILEFLIKISFKISLS